MKKLKKISCKHKNRHKEEQEKMLNEQAKTTVELIRAEISDKASLKMKEACLRAVEGVTTHFRSSTGYYFKREPAEVRLLAIQAIQSLPIPSEKNKETKI